MHIINVEDLNNYEGEHNIAMSVSINHPKKELNIVNYISEGTVKSHFRIKVANAVVHETTDLEKALNHYNKH